MKLTWLEALIRAGQKLTRKNKYIIASALLTLFIFYLIDNGLFTNLVAIAVLTFVIVGAVVITNIENITLKNIILSMVLPLSMEFGLILTFLFFPNLGIILRVGFSVFFGLQFYVVSLMTNIFLVVQTRGEAIPLYRVASTWAQILIVVVGITVFAGVFKIPVKFITQSAIVSLVTIIFCFYLFWVLSFDKDNKKVRIGESVLLSLFAGFLVGVANIAVSFLPTEAFLRAILSANVLLFSTAVIYEHVRNNITRSLLIKNFTLIVIFLIILLVFNP